MSRRYPISVGWGMPCTGMVVSMGDTPPAPFNLRDALTSEPVKTASAIALTFHGYRRTGSILWALLYGLAGRTVPIAAVPISLAQGFGVKKGCP